MRGRCKGNSRAVVTELGYTYRHDFLRRAVVILGGSLPLDCFVHLGDVCVRVNVDEVARRRCELRVT